MQNLGPFFFAVCKLTAFLPAFCHFGVSKTVQFLFYRVTLTDPLEIQWLKYPRRRNLLLCSASVATIRRL